MNSFRRFVCFCLFCPFLSLQFLPVATAQHLTAVRLPTLSGEKFGFQNDAGVVVIKPRFESVTAFVDGCAQVCAGGKCGLIDSTGHEVIPLRYAQIGHFYNGLAGVSLNGRKYGYINKSDQLVIPYTFDEASDFSEGTAVVVLNRRCALINKKGVALTPYNYINMTAMKGGIARVCLHNDSRDGMQYSNFWGFINAQGKEITKLTCYGYESPNLGNGYAVARLAKPDGTPSVIRTEHYTFLLGKSYNYSSVLIDKTGRVVVPASKGYEFSSWGDNYIVVKRDERYGVLDYLTGNELLPVSFHQITDFQFGTPDMPLAKAFITPDDKFFYVNRQFKCVDFDGVKCPEY